MPTAAEAFTALTSNQQEVVNTIRRGLKHKHAPLDSNGVTVASASTDADHDPEEPAAKKKKSSKYRPDTDVYSHVVDSGRFFTRAVHPFDNTERRPDGALKPSARWCQIPRRTNPDTTGSASSTILMSTHCRVQHHPPAQRCPQVPLPPPEAYLERSVRSTKGARQSDTHDVKFSLHYPLPNPTTDDLFPKLPRGGESKSDRGVAHPVTRAFIFLAAFSVRTFGRSPSPTTTKGWSPALMWAIANDLCSDEPSEDGKLILQQLSTGALRFTNDEWSSCFYPDYTIYDANKSSQGLFLGYFPIRILRDIWVGSDAAMNGLDAIAGLPSQCTARAQRVFKVTPRMRHAGARTFLQAANWEAKIGLYDYEKLFNKVVAIFSNTNARQRARKRRRRRGSFRRGYGCNVRRVHGRLDVHVTTLFYFSHYSRKRPTILATSSELATFDSARYTHTQTDPTLFPRYVFNKAHNSVTHGSRIQQITLVSFTSVRTTHDAPARITHSHSHITHASALIRIEQLIMYSQTTFHDRFLYRRRLVPAVKLKMYKSHVLYLDEKEGAPRVARGLMISANSLGIQTKACSVFKLRDTLDAPWTGWNALNAHPGLEGLEMGPSPCKRGKRSPSVQGDQARASGNVSFVCCVWVPKSPISRVQPYNRINHKHAPSYYTRENGLPLGPSDDHFQVFLTQIGVDFSGEHGQTGDVDSIDEPRAPTCRALENLSSASMPTLAIQQARILGTSTAHTTFFHTTFEAYKYLHKYCYKAEGIVEGDAEDIRMLLACYSESGPRAAELCEAAVRPVVFLHTSRNTQVVARCVARVSPSRLTISESTESPFPRDNILPSFFPAAALDSDARAPALASYRDSHHLNTVSNPSPSHLRSTHRPFGPASILPATKTTHRWTTPCRGVAPNTSAVLHLTKVFHAEVFELNTLARCFTEHLMGGTPQGGVALPNGFLRLVIESEFDFNEAVGCCHSHNQGLLLTAIRIQLPNPPAKYCECRRVGVEDSAWPAVGNASTESLFGAQTWRLRTPSASRRRQMLAAGQSPSHFGQRFDLHSRSPSPPRAPISRRSRPELNLHREHFYAPTTFFPAWNLEASFYPDGVWRRSKRAQIVHWNMQQQTLHDAPAPFVDGALAVFTVETDGPRATGYRCRVTAARRTSTTNATAALGLGDSLWNRRKESDNSPVTPSPSLGAAYGLNSISTSAFSLIALPTRQYVIAAPQHIIDLDSGHGRVRDPA
ncbi:hypothetical protein C8F01DRAFT_1092994 [Mycena amicta]|nr:hypothetical protein C8F01DRAFT_1092994 [Mycena amicta]